MNRAKVRRAAGDFEAGDYAAVFLLALFSFQSVDIKHFLIPAFFAERVAVVGIGGAAGFKGSL